MRLMISVYLSLFWSIPITQYERNYWKPNMETKTKSMQTKIFF